MDRRKFLSNSIISGAAVVAGGSILNSCNSQNNELNYEFPPMLDSAPDGKLLKAGLVGCGSRGTGAAFNFLDAGNNLEITALADVFQDKLDNCRKELKEKRNTEIADENCFVGFDAYQKLIESDVDIVLLCTPPHFRPAHFEACVRAKKHVFMEKPIAVDPIGARSVLINGERVEKLGLSVITGTIKRHQKDYLETFKKVRSGSIGDIISANTYYNQGKLWHKNPQANWSEMEIMLRDWVNWCWLSGDHIVEQHVHNLDLMNWFIGSHPEKAVGFGARQKRLTGDQYDMFSVDFTYANDVHVHSMCRQINGCENNVSDLIRGTKGYTNCENTIFKPNGDIKWKFPLNEEQEKDRWHFFWRSYLQEHIDLVTAIRTNKPINEAKNIAESTLTGIMGRISAYTGKLVTWDEILNTELKLGPKHYIMGKVDYKSNVPVPGI
jgi:predicted dehydrogenase